MSEYTVENDAGITEDACQRLRAYVYQHEGMCWCGFDSEGVNGEGETLDHIVHSLVDDWQGFLAAARPIPPEPPRGFGLLHGASDVPDPIITGGIDPDETIPPAEPTTNGEPR